MLVQGEEAISDPVAGPSPLASLDGLRSVTSVAHMFVNSAEFPSRKVLWEIELETFDARHARRY